ncbi:outer membrane lipoprotein LolB [Litorilituus sediminis]|uniref:Outer-membrane lipoprotein LolB n=2 Tax=Litorilituus sediminis TaxID=718192 RepID=A0A4P6PCS3_9GAMM|nr:outer membrane lipoprotein LolB [Litorilituus sediminis]
MINTQSSSIYRLLTILVLAMFFLSACTTNKAIPPIESVHPHQERAQLLQQLSQWQITGKIAFIQSNKRERANFHWQINEETQQQNLNLTSYLGINVLQLSSSNGHHKVKVDGKTYQGEDLTALIYQLTGFTLPTKALNFWLKGLPYLDSDQISYHPETQLPEYLLSSLETNTNNHEAWRIHYGNYQAIKQFILAKKLTISKGDLTIKLVIDKWRV